MHSEAESQSSTFTWAKSFEKSISDNAQLVFSKKITVSTINPEDSIPYSEILDVQEIRGLDENLSAIVCYADNRSIFYNSLIKNSMTHIINFFPLTREKFKMNCLTFSFSGNGSHTLDITNNDQLKKYLSLNYKYNKTTHNQLISLTNDQYVAIAEEYIIQIMKEIAKEKIDEALKFHWSKLNNETKLDYEAVDKDSLKSNENNKLEKDIENFDAQEEVGYSKNFSLLYFIPLDVEHCIYPMPQVVANSRRPNFESLIKPHKKPKKYFFTLNFHEFKWHLKELNA